MPCHVQIVVRPIGFFYPIPGFLTIFCQRAAFICFLHRNTALNKPFFSLPRTGDASLTKFRDCSVHWIFCYGFAPLNPGVCAREPYRASILFGPQLTDLCIEGIVCWGQFYKSFRPFDQRILIFRPADGEEKWSFQLTHDEYLHLVLSVYKRYHKGVHPPGTTNSRMLASCAA